MLLPNKINSLLYFTFIYLSNRYIYQEGCTIQFYSWRINFKFIIFKCNNSLFLIKKTQFYLPFFLYSWYCFSSSFFSFVVYFDYLRVLLFSRGKNDDFLDGFKIECVLEYASLFCSISICYKRIISYPVYNPSSDTKALARRAE